MDEQLARGLRLVLIPGKPAFAAEVLARHDMAFTFWQSFWTETLRGLGETPQLKADDFLRHEVIAMLELDGVCVGQHAYCFYDLNLLATPHLGFISQCFPSAYIDHLKAQNLRHVMSMEYLAVAAEWRSARAGVSLAKVLVNLGGYFAREAKVDAIFGAARADAPVATMSYDTGARAFEKGVLIHGKPTDLVYWPLGEIRPSSDLKVRALAARLWQERRDHTTHQFRHIAAA